MLCVGLLCPPYADFPVLGEEWGGWEQWLGPGSAKRDQRGQHLNRGLGPVDLTAHFIGESRGPGKEVFVQDLTMNEPEPDPELVFFPSHPAALLARPFRTPAELTLCA